MNRDYELAMLEQHTPGTVQTICGYVISQLRRGKFNKWTKTLSDHYGAVEVYQELEDAQRRLAAFNPDIRPYFAIFPVVAIAAEEPIQ